MVFFRRSSAFLALAVLLAAPHGLPGQHGGGGGHGSGMGGPGGGVGPRGADGSSGLGGNRFPNGSPSGNRQDSAGVQRNGLQLGPPGRWWDDKHFAKSLKLRTDQQLRMDSLFEQNRPVLLRRYQALEQEQIRMEGLLRAGTLEEGSLYAQIDRIAQARAELEKANTHYLLQIRGEMDLDQIAHLELLH